MHCAEWELSGIARREEEMAYSKENLKPQAVTQNYPKAQEQKTAAKAVAL